MSLLSLPQFLHSLPPLVRPLLPLPLRDVVQVNQPFRWLVQFHVGEPRLHYEVSRVSGQAVLELGLHFEDKDSRLNEYLRRGFEHHLLELHHTFSPHLVAEPWDNGWAKVYERYPAPELTNACQTAVAHHLAQFITHLHPIFATQRGHVAQVYR
jgi:hypothetical protein